MHFLMTAFGSYGDVHPIAGLGGALRARGHDVSIIANPHFRSVVEAVGAEHIALGTLDDYQIIADNPDVWHPVRGPLLVMRLAMAKYLRETYERIESLYRPGETVLVSHGLDIASRVFQEKMLQGNHNALLANAILQPMMLRSLHESPKMGTLLMASWAPRWLRSLQYWAADKLVNRIVGPELNSLRSELGLKPEHRVFGDWFFSPQLALGLFPEWFAPTQPDWPSQVRLTGFPLWDEPAATGLPAEVNDFLRGGESPIVFTPGSAMAHGQEFFQAAVDACRLLHRRGMLLTKYPQQLPSELPDSVRHFGFVPFSQLLPRAAAIVHHGGIGSCAQGLNAGLPQLLMPMAYDQPDNAARLKKLGVAESLPPKKFHGPAVAYALNRLLTNEKVQERCHHWARQCDAEASLAASCELLEGLRK